MGYVDFDLLTSLASQQNFRGVTNPDIVFEILDIRQRINILDVYPEDATGSSCPQGCTEAEWVAGWHHYWDKLITSLTSEIDRRKVIAEKFPDYNADREVISAIKERVPVEDVISWYTEVFYHGTGSRKEQLQFRCPLHQDRHPSGVIYLKERRWHCYQCQQHGDVFDAVCQFERVDLPRAIKKLGAYIGVEIRPLREKLPPVRKPEPPGRGMKGLSL